MKDEVEPSLPIVLVRAWSASSWCAEGVMEVGRETRTYVGGFDMFVRVGRVAVKLIG